jgi:hypothetical protein
MPVQLLNYINILSSYLACAKTTTMPNPETTKMLVAKYPKSVAPELSTEKKSSSFPQHFDIKFGRLELRKLIYGAKIYATNDIIGRKLFSRAEARITRRSPRERLKAKPSITFNPAIKNRFLKIFRRVNA